MGRNAGRRYRCVRGVGGAYGEGHCVVGMVRTVWRSEHGIVKRAKLMYDKL